MHRTRDDVGDMAEPRPSILLVDDTDIVRRTVTMLLEMDGWTVAGASGIDEAMRLFEAHRATLLVAIVDVRLGADDGTALVATLRRMERTLPVVLVTGLSDDAYERPDGVVVLQKPFGGDALFDAIRRAVTGAPRGDDDDRDRFVGTPLEQTPMLAPLSVASETPTGHG